MDYKKIYGDLFKTNYNLDPDNEYRYTLVHEFLKNNEIKSFIDIDININDLEVLK